MNTSDLIQPRHLSRRAIVYVRQSTTQQVNTRQESQKLQYGLLDRAVQLGWHEQDVEIVDADLGHTASTTEGRVGFQYLVSEVALQKVGVVIAYDATRLARNCSHWYQLLDLCGHADCLIADRDGVYDPCSINGRLLLGLKGQISEMELHTIRARLLAGKQAKAQRGELAIPLPVGYVKLEDGRVAKHPDREVQSRIELIFKMLIEKQSLGKVVRYLNANDLKVPRRSYIQRIGVEWKRATVSKVGEMVKNPIYAGAYVYGRRRKNPGKTGTTCSPVPRPEWQVCLQDRRPAYISWDTYLRIEEMLRDNYAEYNRNKTRGVPRDGTALLHGIMHCGQCGHQMGVQYKGCTRYICNRLRQISPDVPVCQYLPADPIDQQVTQWFFEALSVAHIDLAQQTLQEADENHAALLASRRQQLTRLQYEAQLAERQYQQTDPDNRLVAAELESRWECALRELKAEEERQAAEEGKSPCWAIPSELLETLKDVGPQLPEIWRQGLFTTPQKKKLLRSIVNKVVVYRIGGSKGARIHIRVVWRGGATTSGEALVNVGKFSQLERAEEMEQRVVDLSREGHAIADIARQLTAEGFRSPHSSHVLCGTVTNIRRRTGVYEKARSRPVHVPGYLTLTELAKTTGIRREWFQEKISQGIIRIEKNASTRCYLFPDKKKTLADLRKLHQGKIEQLVYGGASR
jgi:DNA invertase Pin-like site-specific DNA recombinase